MVLNGYTDFIFGSGHQIRDRVRVNPRSNVDRFFLISTRTAEVDGEPGFGWVVQGGIPFDGDTADCLFGDTDVNVDIFIPGGRWRSNGGEE